jgi:hypothetical protein
MVGSGGAFRLSSRDGAGCPPCLRGFHSHPGLPDRGGVVGEPPSAANSSLHRYISNLRKELGRDQISALCSVRWFSALLPVR